MYSHTVLRQISLPDHKEEEATANGGSGTNTSSKPTSHDDEGVITHTIIQTITRTSQCNTFFSSLSLGLFFKGQLQHFCISSKAAQFRITRIRDAHVFIRRGHHIVPVS